MFRQPTQRDDKVFRFYMDRGLSTEVTKDVLVTSVGREIAHVALSNVSALQSWSTTEQPVSFLVSPGFSPYGSVTVNNAKRLLSWTNPLVGYFDRSTLNEESASPKSYSLGKQNYYPDLQANTAYSVTTHLNYFNILRQAKTPPMTFAAVNLSANQDMDVADACMISLDNRASNLTVVDRFTRELARLEAFDDVASVVPINGVSRPLQLLEVLQRSIGRLNSDDETVSLSLIDARVGKITILEIKTTGLTSIG